MNYRTFLGALVLAPMLAVAQSSVTPEKPAPIQDNSFLVEEAYNQDAGTVQHISTFSHASIGRDWAYSFTQEWAFRGQQQQLSVTVPVARVDGDPRGSWGMGDVAFNYRYQITGVDGGPVAFAPRVSLVAPTGRASSGLGAGAFGVQLMLPMSIELGSSFVTHLNAGVSRMGGTGGNGRAVTTNLAHSLVWLAAQRVNLLVETAFSSTRATAAGISTTERSLVVSPGVRWSHDVKSLQIVPGLAFPIGVGPSAGSRAVFVYLSFEHPY